MPDLGNSRRKLKVAIGAMLAVDLVAIGILVSPLVGSEIFRQQQLGALRIELQKKKREVEPLSNIDKKIVLAKGQISGFYKDRFAAKDSDLINELGKLASENGVHIQQAKYKEEEQETSGVTPVAMEVSFSGDYLQLVRFINTLERSKMFFEVDGVDLAGESAGPVKLQISIHSFLRAGA
jgi:Type II secretion system (T2SS), protein M subtype b